MAEINEDELLLHENHSSILNVIFYDCVTSMAVTIFPLEFSAAIALLITIITICTLSIKEEPFVSLLNLLLLLVYFVYQIAGVNLPLLITGFIMVVIGGAGTSVLMLVCLLYKKPPTSSKIGILSVRLQVAIIQALIVIFFNGYTMLVQWCFLQQGYRFFWVAWVLLILHVFFLFLCSITFCNCS